MKEKTRTLGKQFGISLLILFAWAFAIHLGWNMAITNIFAMDAIRFREALGLAFLAGSLTFPFWFGVRFRGQNKHCSHELEGKAA